MNDIKLTRRKNAQYTVPLILTALGGMSIILFWSFIPNQELLVDLLIYFARAVVGSVIFSFLVFCIFVALFELQVDGEVVV